MNNGGLYTSSTCTPACVLPGRLRLPSCTLSKQMPGTGTACSASAQGHSLKAGEARGTSLEPGDPTWGHWLLISPSSSQQAVAGPASRLPCTASGCCLPTYGHEIRPPRPPTADRPAGGSSQASPGAGFPGDISVTLNAFKCWKNQWALIYVSKIRQRGLYEA